MFGKVSLESFVYDLTETFFFPNTQTKEIYNYYMIDWKNFSILDPNRHGQHLYIYFLSLNRKVVHLIRYLEMFYLK